MLFRTGLMTATHKLNDRLHLRKYSRIKFISKKKLFFKTFIYFLKLFFLWVSYLSGKVRMICKFERPMNKCTSNLQLTRTNEKIRMTDLPVIYRLAKILRSS